QAIKQSSNQAIKQRYHTFITFYPFTKTYLKIPYFLLLNFILSFINPIIPSCINPIIPSCINPHHLFKPFDSIIPIFKPVGLTELNSIQGEDNGKSRRGVKKTLSNFSGC
ncbi:hypothetical protein ACOWMN_07055, partial [Helicobacter pylori]